MRLRRVAIALTALAAATFGTLASSTAPASAEIPPPVYTECYGCWGCDAVVLGTHYPIYRIPC